MIPTENVEVKPDGQLILQNNHKDLVVKGDATFTGDIDAQNGVLQIDQIVLPEGATQSVKKIYIHPIIAVDNTNNIGISLFIFNNDNTPIDNWNKLKTALINIATSINDTARIPISGSAISSGTEVIARNLDVRTDGTIILYGRGTNSTNISIDITEYTIYNVYDGVNPIN